MALMTSIIHCLLDPEPDGFHPPDAALRTLAVNLGFECLTDVARADIVGETAQAEAKRGELIRDEKDARDRFTAFIESAKAVRFHLFAATTTSPGKCPLEHRGEISLQISDVASPNAADDVTTWLGKAAPGPSDIGHCWTTPLHIADPETSVEATAAGATYRLRAAHSWNAPVGHRLGLTHILRVEGIAEETTYVVLPFFSTPAEPLPAIAGTLLPDQPDLCDFIYDAGGAVGEITCRTETLVLPKAFIVKPEEISDFLTADGHLKVDADADELWRITKWYEARAASLMAPAGALAGPGAGAGSKDDEAYGALFQWSYGTQENPLLLDAPAPAWLAAASLCAALDNIVIGIMKPVSGEHVIGDILAPLVFDLLDRFEDTIADTFQLPENRCDLPTLTGVLRAVLASNNPLVRNMLDPVAVPAREKFCNVLLDVHGISSPSAEAPIEIRLLNLLLDSFGKEADVTVDEKHWPAVKDNGPSILHRALAEAEQRLQEEAGAEAAITRLLEATERTEIIDGNSVTTKIPALFAGAYSQIIGRYGDAALEAAVAAAFGEALRTYRILLHGAFNGAEAVRRAAANEFTKALLSYAKSNPRTAVPAAERLIEVATGADYYAVRLLGLVSARDPDDPPSSADCFRPFANVLVRPPFPETRSDDRKVPPPSSLLPFLTASYQSVLDSMMQLNDGSARFIPDTSPAPLPIQIAANIDGKEIDGFSRYFNGIGVAIRRIDKGDGSDRWAHASLAELTWPFPPLLKSDGPAIELTVAAAIHPLLPAVSDGRGPMFIEYEGLPLAATTFAKTAAEAVADTPPAFVPFYLSGVPDLETSRFARIPRLAYGRAFQTLGFATTNAGSLPRALQGALPWIPKADFKVPEKDGQPDRDFVLTAEYQRRTAIGQIAVNEAPGVHKPRRLAVPIAGVAPLADDYPRTVISSFADNPGARDIFRERDGTGTLFIPATAEAPIEWPLSDAVLTGGRATLVATLFTTLPKAPGHDGATARITFPTNIEDGALTEIAFGVERIDIGEGNSERNFYIRHGENKKPVAFPVHHDIAAGWLRLSLESTDPASLSFAVTDDVKPYEPGAPLLMLAPQSDRWTSDLSAPVAVKIDTPRVGYLDFERWFANADLRKAAFSDEKTGTFNEKAAANLQGALLTAYVLRDADEEIARALDRLPDPAVEGIRIELAVQDRIAETAPPVQCAADNILFGKKLFEIAKNIPSGQIWSPFLLKKHVLVPIEEAFRLSLSLKPGDFGLFDDDLTTSVPPGIVARVPPGVVARLSIDALVPERHFQQQTGHPAVFHAGMKQHASRRLPMEEPKKKFLAFPSAALCIETMLNGVPAITGNDKQEAIALAADMIAVRPIARSRRYDLQTRPAVPGTDRPKRTRQWRLLSEIDVTTQRWRPSGRPIYNHIDPMSFHDAKALLNPLSPETSSAALPLCEHAEKGSVETDHPLSRFEQQAFFDRPDIDSQTVTQRLLPLPSSTVLEQHSWDAPSATYFRHRFTLRSRYAGALPAIADKEVKAWITDRKKLEEPAQAWTLRVAMLADLSRMLLTRPQQRALIPLTTAPRDDGTATGAPPVLSILQEPPFSRGGLADRIAAEIRTGFGYGFAGEGGDTVEILDSRKEIGPDPRLSYKAFDKNAALGMALNAEGPMGLTFDAINAPAPAFPNSMLSLSPVSLVGDGQNLEEHFLGISMRRYIDPYWTIEGGAPDICALDAERCWWIRRDAPVRPGSLMSYAADGVEAPLLTIAADGGAFVVKIKKVVVDGAVGGAIEPDVVIARCDTAFADRLSILHQPVAPGRYSTSVFVLPAKHQGTVAKGYGNAPLLICNFEWGPPKTTGGTMPVAVTLKAEHSEMRATMASAPTFLSWTRTGRNFGTVHSPDAGDAPEVPVRELLASLDRKSSTLTFDRSGATAQYWLCSSTFRKPFPLHVQRHLAVLTTRYLDEPGRPVEEYRRSALVVGRTSGQLAGAGKDDGESEDCLRIVEFETPAAILCGSAPSVPETYRMAYFDLLSTGFRLNGKGEASLRLFFRFPGPAGHLKKFSHLTVGLRFSETDDDRLEIPIDLAQADAEHFITAIELLLEQNESGTLTYRSSLLRSDGHVLDGSQAKTIDARLLAADNHNPGFFLDIKAKGDAGAGEFWADVSLLHMPRAKFASCFDFNWLFSQTGGAEPAMAVTAAALSEMVEAQARIVSVSPPISIRSTAAGA